MRGQWIGIYEGTNGGQIILDMDDEGSHFRGTAVAFENDPNLPSIVAGITTTDRTLPQKLKIRDLAVIRPGSTQLISRDDFAEEFPEVSVPTELTVTFTEITDGLRVDWASDVGTQGSGTLLRSRCDMPSDVAINTAITTWDQFKEYVFALGDREWMFRGQGVSKRLRTSFHRSRRTDLLNYISKIVPEAHRALTARTRHLFNLSIGEQNGAFLNLLQHHGFPTPLLDWSHSPFVAAFFAYRHGGRRETESDKVRIFMFARASWVADWSQISVLTFARPHFSILEALSIENPRAIPQQAISSVTNVDDIESYIHEREVEKNKVYLHVIDLPFSERRRVMHELSLMGITAGSLFPGLDGACEELSGRFFHPLP